MRLDILRPHFTDSNWPISPSLVERHACNPIPIS
jgi:hypothetical protein